MRIMYKDQDITLILFANYKKFLFAKFDLILISKVFDVKSSETFG